MAVQRDQPPLFQQPVANEEKLHADLAAKGLVRTGFEVASPLAKVEHASLAEVSDSPLGAIPNAVAEFMQLIRVAIENKLDPGKLHEGLSKERDRQAKAWFVAAKAKFKKECPPIPKSQANPQFKVEREGTTRMSMFAPLESMQTIADPHLEANGLSYDWKEPPPGPNGERYLHFVLSHIGGHSEEYPARITPPEKGGCSEPQKDGIAYEYARRQSFRNGTGIRVVGEDNDGNDPPPATSTIDENQRRTVNDMLIEAGLPEGQLRKEWLAIYGCGTIAEIKSSLFAVVTNALKYRIDRMRK